MDDTCIFCKIVAGTVPANKVYEDEDFIAFPDINPVAPLHLLLVPKQHIATLADCTNAADVALLGKLLGIAPVLAQKNGYGYHHGAKAAEEGQEGGFRLVINTGPGGGQEIYHFHMHLLAGARPWKRMS